MVMNTSAKKCILWNAIEDRLLIDMELVLFYLSPDFVGILSRILLFWL